MGAYNHVACLRKKGQKNPFFPTEEIRFFCEKEKKSLKHGKIFLRV